MTANKHFELLSPAGSYEKMLFAFAYGADSVYAGARSYSLREGAANLSVEELAAAVSYAHQKSKKFYIAANIFFHDRHFRGFRDFLTEISGIPLDGILLSDIGALSYIREKYPSVPVHVSTQANTVNSEAVRFYEKLGVKRVVLARELSLDEIRAVRDATELELECFVHGAMCVAYSGRCLLSNYFTSRSLCRGDEKPAAMKRAKARDANLGDCAQSCRWDYAIVEMSRRDQFLPLEETENGTAVLSSKDLNLSRHMRELMEAGIDSFKIEGRMKSAYYVANVTRSYRRVVDDIVAERRTPEEVFRELDKISHREYTTGFFFNENLALAPTRSARYIREYTFLGHVLGTDGSGGTLVRAMNQIRQGTRLEVIKPDGANIELDRYELVKDGRPVRMVQPNDEFVLTAGAPLGRFDILRCHITD